MQEVEKTKEPTNSKEHKLTKYVNREISWLSFNARVLQECTDLQNPLIERIRFLGIFSSNRDEFFRVRVATVKRALAVDAKSKEFLGMKPKKILSKIQKINLEQDEQFMQAYAEILEELSQINVRLIPLSQINDRQTHFLRHYYEEKISPLIVPIMLESVKDLSFVKDSSIYLAVKFTSVAEGGKSTFSLIEIPAKDLPRFVVLPSEKGKEDLMFLDDVIRYNLPQIFSIFQFRTIEAYTVKLTRDAELDLNDDFGRSFSEKVAQSVEMRKYGDPIRFIYDKEIPQDLIALLQRKLHLEEGDSVIAGDRYHNFKDFMKFPVLGGTEHVFEPMPPLPIPELDQSQSMLSVIKQKDIIFHYPYHSFRYFIDLFRQCAIDPAVESIAITLYRVAPHSKIINSLINAAINGKKVTVVVEIQARFDEELNLFWSRRMQEAGIKVIFSLPGLKVHSKLVLISRQEGDALTQYATIATGNFNEETAKIYCDHSLLTADLRITTEVAKVFQFFKNQYKLHRYNDLIVSPFYTRNELSKLIRREMDFAKAGKPASMILKMNSITDRKMIDLLYRASNAGVQIDMIVRGICCLVPGIENQSENIQVRSIVDRYLEHARVYVFGNNGNPDCLLGSADLMSRNLDRRVEVLCPVYDDDVRKELIDILQLQLQDNSKAREIDTKQTNRYIKNAGSEQIRAQFDTYRYLEKKSEAAKR